MIELSADQVAVLGGDAFAPACIVNPQTKEEYVLIRREVYEQLRSVLGEDFSSEDAFRAQIESAAGAGWDDAALDIYNDIETRILRTIGQLSAGTMLQIGFCLKASLELP